jgi:hypothetical protein
MTDQTASEVLYKDQLLSITRRAVEQTWDMKTVTYPVAKIETVAHPTQEPFELFGGLLLNGAVALFGLWCFFHFTIGWMIAGVIAMGIGGFNVRGEFSRPWWIEFKVAGEIVKIHRSKKDDIDKIYAALRQTIGN